MATQVNVIIHELLMLLITKCNHCYCSYHGFWHIHEANWSFYLVLTHYSRLHAAVNKRGFAYRLNYNNSYSNGMVGTTVKTRIEKNKQINKIRFSYFILIFFVGSSDDKKPNDPQTKYA